MSRSKLPPVSTPVSRSIIHRDNPLSSIGATGFEPAAFWSQTKSGTDFTTQENQVNGESRPDSGGGLFARQTAEDSQSDPKQEANCGAFGITDTDDVGAIRRKIRLAIENSLIYGKDNPKGRRQRRRDAKRICYPGFSDEDRDLEQIRWRLSNQGYALASFHRKWGGGDATVYILAHKIVQWRMLGRRCIGDEVCDHINRVRTDNRRSNLRTVTKRQNSQNCSATNPTGIRGVTFCKQTKKWVAQVKCGKTRYWYGGFKNPEEAGAAAAKKRNELGFLGGGE